MAKGFGTKPDKQLGYVLDLMPKIHAYAGKFSLDFPGDEGPFIGITSELEDAQAWKKLDQARKAITTYYADFLMDQIEESSTATVAIKCLKKTSGGKLKTENAEVLTFSAADLKA